MWLNEPATLLNKLREKLSLKVMLAYRKNFNGLDKQKMPDELETEKFN